MADVWPDWLPENVKGPGVLYSVRRASADGFCVAYADPLGTTIVHDVTRDDLIHGLLVDYSAPPLPMAQIKRGYVLRTRVQK